DAAQTEEDLFGYTETESDLYDAAETEEDLYDYTETETELPPAPTYNAADYLVIDDDGYKELTVQVPAAKQTTDVEVNDQIEQEFQYVENYDDYVKKITSGKVKYGDVVNIDYEGTKDGKPFDGGTAENYNLEIGSDSFIFGFEDDLIGKEIGSECDLDLTFPEEYPVEDLAGEDVVFHVTINYVGEMPELTDELAEKLSYGEYDNVEDYVQSVRDEIQAGYDEEHKNEAYTAIMTSLADMYPVEKYPEENVDYQVDMMMKQFEAFAPMYGMDVDSLIESFYGMKVDEFIENELTPSAENALAQEIILTAISEKEGITMDDEELDERLAERAEAEGVSVETFTGGLDRETVRSYLLQDKVMDWLYQNVRIEDIEETENYYTFGNETEAETESVFGNETEAETESVS
ncbi:MAG TPA: trigger factor, partial [Lachnospiraceae bacterium]|nr:trigger factor [Lachnospiraceae bacterium]